MKAPLGSILQYFWPALSDNWSWKPIFGLFESGSFTQELLQYFWSALSNNWSWKPIFGLFESGSFTHVLLLFNLITILPNSSKNFSCAVIVWIQQNQVVHMAQNVFKISKHMP